MDGGDTEGAAFPAPVVRGIDIAQLKRLSEWILAKPVLEDRFRADPGGTMTSLGLTLDPEVVRPIWDPQAALTLSGSGEDHPALSASTHIRWTVRDAHLLASLEDEAFANPAHRAWRRRQMARAASQFHKAQSDELIHIPLAFELSTGCSGRCAFCCLDSGPLTDVFAYTPGNARLWRDSLEAVRGIFGRAAAASICYWATDAFDNPHYERFCEDYAAVLGLFPPTTTALPLKNIPRTRDFLALTRRHGRPFVRFSITTSRMAERVFATFTPEDLLPVVLVLNNPESRNLYSPTGRARTAMGERFPMEKIHQGGSSACVSGFIVNMPQRTVRLVTPHPPGKDTPLGYRMLDEATFADAPDLGATLERMIARHMPRAWPRQVPLRFRDDVRFEATERGFRASTRFMTRTFTGGDGVRAVGEAIAAARYHVADLVQRFEWSCIPAAYVEATIQQIFDAGLLDERAY